MVPFYIIIPPTVGEAPLKYFLAYMFSKSFKMIEHDKYILKRLRYKKYAPWGGGGDDLGGGDKLPSRSDLG